MLDAASERILKYDPASGNLISDFDINVINQGHSVGVVDLVGGMGETADGTGLFTRTSTHALLINPETGVIEEATSLSGSRLALAGAAGELISNGGAAINVDTQSGLRIRRMSTGFVPYGLAAAEVSATQHWVRAAPDSNHAGLAFLSQPDFDFGDE